MRQGGVTRAIVHQDIALAQIDGERLEFATPVREIRHIAGKMGGVIGLAAYRSPAKGFLLVQIDETPG